MSKQSIVPVDAEGAATREVNPLAFLQQEFDRLFEGIARTFPALTASGWVVPRLDIAETDKEIEISAELPGLETKDVTLNLSDNILTIRGEKKSESERKDREYRLVERSFGSFTRNVELPTGVKPENVTAEIAKGVLKVVVRKPEPKVAKQIEIKNAA